MAVWGMNHGDDLLKRKLQTASSVPWSPVRSCFVLVSDQFIITDLTGVYDPCQTRAFSTTGIRCTEIACWIEAHQYQTVFTISAGIIDTKDRMNGYYDQITWASGVRPE